MKRTPFHLLAALLFTTPAPVFAQESQPFDTRAAILFGLNQPLLARGFNIEGNVFYRRLVFDYSHGVSLDFSGSSVSGAMKEQGLAVHMPYTTGLGVGYRFSPWLNARVEPNWHRFELYYDGKEQTATNLVAGYNTFSLGLGLYGTIRPFRKLDNALSGIIVAPSLRYWPTLSSSLSGGKHTYFNRVTDRQETHERMQPGVVATPFIVNVSVGYSVAL